MQHKMTSKHYTPLQI